MKIKTFPLQFTEEKLKQIESVAGEGNKKSFMLEAIDEKLIREEKKLRGES